MHLYHPEVLSPVTHLSPFLPIPGSSHQPLVRQTPRRIRKRQPPAALTGLRGPQAPPLFPKRKCPPPSSPASHGRVAAPRPAGSLRCLGVGEAQLACVCSHPLILSVFAGPDASAPLAWTPGRLLRPTLRGSPRAWRAGGSACDLGQILLAGLSFPICTRKFGVGSEFNEQNIPLPGLTS